MLLVGYKIIPFSRNVAIFVKTEVPIAIDIILPLAGKVGGSYQDSFETTGGSEPHSYTVTSENYQIY